jgi:hypothetical protein
MIDLELSWPQAVVSAGVLGVAAAAMRLSGRPRLAKFAVFPQEIGLILGLFALWQYAGSFGVAGPEGALGRSRWIWHAERVLHLPSEASVQRLFLGHPLIIQGFNLYYDGLHFPVLCTLLIWLLVLHRPCYRRVRTTLALLTGGCLLIQLMPVAPPRMLPEAGMTDTAIKYGQSVYGTTTGFNPDQLSAMPSVHVAWALLVAVAVITASASRWRWLILGYPVMTTLAVVVTANHFWADGIVAGAVLVLALALQSGTRWLWGRYVTAGLSRRPRSAAAPVTAGAGLSGPAAGSRPSQPAASDPGASPG